MPEPSALRRTIVVALVALSVVFASLDAQAADKKALGRKASVKANYWANHGDCKQALPLFTKAYKLLKDPVILFNRGECYRKTGQKEKAVADYKQFLVEIPAAPNKGQVESRIAELEGGAKPSDVAVVTATAGVVTPPAPGTTPAPPPPPPVAVAVAPPPPAKEPLLEPGSAGSPPPGGNPSDKDLGFKPLSGESPVPPMVATPAPAASSDDGGSIFGTWWFWTIVGVAVVGGAAGGYVAANSGKTEVPMSALGNYKF